MLPQLLLPPRLIVFDSVEEQQSYDFFRSRSVGELTALFHTDEKFWYLSVLQLSMTQPEVRYALTALGAMHRIYTEGDSTSIPEGTGDAQTRFALEQCNRSIKTLLGRAASEARYEKVSTLVACILYTCLASVQGHQMQSIMHFQNGLKLLDSLAHPTGTDKLSKTNRDVHFQSFLTTLSSLEVQARSLICDQALPPWPTRIEIRRPLSSTSKVKFANLSEGRDYFESILSDFQCFAIEQDAAGEWLLSPGAKARPSALEKYQLLLDRHGDGAKALDNFVVSHGDLKKRDEKMILMLRLHITIVEMYLRIYPLSLEHGESAYDHIEVEAYYLRMIHLGRQVLGCTEENLASMLHPAAEVEELGLSPSDGTDIKRSKIPAVTSILKKEFHHHRRQPVFTFSQGVVGPLSTVARESRSPSIRREALALLLLHPRREGLWDSHTAGRVGFVTMCLEEDLSRHLRSPGDPESVQITTASDVPIECRVRVVEMKYIGPRTSVIRFNTIGDCQKGDNKGGMVKILGEYQKGQRQGGMVKILEW